MSEAEIKYFVSAFLRFVKNQITERQFTSDIVESLEVASQCLETAYDLVPVALNGENETIAGSDSGADNTNDLSNPMAHVDLFDLFRNSFGQVSVEKKLEAENIKNEGNCLMRDEKFYEALNAYNRSISLDATNPVFYCNRAAAYSKLGEYQKAVDDCKMSLRYDPAYSKAYGRLGFAYSKLNKLDLAKDALLKACDLDPQNEDYKINLNFTQQKLEESLNTSANQLPDISRLLQNLPADMPELVGNNTLMSVARLLLNDTEVQNLLSSMQSQTREQLTEAGMQFFMRQANPEFLNFMVDRVRNAMDDPSSNPNPDLSGQQQQPPPPPPPPPPSQQE